VCTHRIEQERQDARHRLFAMLQQDLLDALLAEHPLCGILRLEDAVGDQPKDIARRKIEPLRWLEIREADKAERERGRRQPFAAVLGRTVMQQRPLARRMKLHVMAVGVEQAPRTPSRSAHRGDPRRAGC
jgi:hypothetical protein